MKTPQVAKVCYFAAVYADPDGGYWTKFADFPAFDQGETIEDAVRQLTIFLQDIIDEKSRLKQKLPAPSGIEEFKKKLAPQDGEVVCIVPVFAYLSSPAVRVQITAKANQIAAIDEYARQHNLTRSDVLINSALAAIR